MSLAERTEDLNQKGLRPPQLSAYAGFWEERTEDLNQKGLRLDPYQVNGLFVEVKEPKT